MKTCYEILAKKSVVKVLLKYQSLNLIDQTLMKKKHTMWFWQ